MGIYQLNQYLKSKCRKSIQEIKLGELAGKTIVIDSSIYMYKFAGEQRLVEGMYQLISTMLYYKITPLFIFDGVPPAEKKALLDARNTQKRAAKHEYYTIIESFDENGGDEEKRNNARVALERLQKKFVRLSKQDYSIIHELMNCFGVKYINAVGEADELCAKLVIDGTAWACMSEDTDMFVYGCPRVLRYVSLIHFTCVLYNMDGILKELQMSQSDFSEVCVLSGTDYNFNAKRKTSLQTTMLYYIKYKKSKGPQSKFSEVNSQSKFSEVNSQSKFSEVNSQSKFYEWLIKNTNYIVGHTDLIKTLQMFDITTLDFTNEIVETSKTTTYDEKKLHTFLKKFNFIFM